MDYGSLAPRNPPPLYSTPRSNRETLGGEIADVLARSGSAGNSLSKTLLPVMPWQRDVLDIIGEIDPANGLFWYRTVMLICVRQSGKTTVTRGKLNHRALVQRNARMLYTAQDRNMGRKRLEATLYKPIRASVLGNELIRPRWAAGSEAVRWANGSELVTQALSETSGHGDTLDEAHIDEAFAHTDNRIEQAVKPAMSTVQGAQMVISSAAGNLNSSFLMQKMEYGRALAQQRTTTSRTCYIEYSADLSLDPDDPETLLGTHPGIGHSTTFEIVWDDKSSMDKVEWERSYLGWFPKPKDRPSVIPWAAWTNNYVEPSEYVWSGIPMWCVDVSPERDSASIALAANSTIDGRCFVELVAGRQTGNGGDGTAWLIPKLKQLRSKYGGERVVVDDSGAAKSLIEDLEDAGFEVVKTSLGEKGAACGAFFDDCVQGNIHYLDDAHLNKAMRDASWMWIYSGESRIFSRSRSMSDITPLYAVTLARWAYVKFRVYDPMASI